MLENCLAIVLASELLSANTTNELVPLTVNDSNMTLTCLAASEAHWNFFRQMGQVVYPLGDLYSSSVVLTALVEELSPLLGTRGVSRPAVSPFMVAGERGA